MTDMNTDKDELRIKVAEIVVREFLIHERLEPWQRDDHELLAFGGGESFGLWIYRRPDKTLYGMNYSSLEELRSGTVEEHAKRHNYPGDLNACHEFEKILSESIVSYISNLFTILRKDGVLISSGRLTAVDCWAIRNAEPEQLCRAFVKTMEGK